MGKPGPNIFTRVDDNPVDLRIIGQKMFNQVLAEISSGSMEC